MDGTHVLVSSHHTPVSQVSTAGSKAEPDVPHMGESSVSCRRKQLPFIVCSFPKEALISNLDFQVPNKLISLRYSFPCLVVGKHAGFGHNALIRVSWRRGHLRWKMTIASNANSYQNRNGRNVGVESSGTAAKVEMGGLEERNVKKHTQEGSMKATSNKSNAPTEQHSSTSKGLTGNSL